MQEQMVYGREHKKVLPDGSIFTNFFLHQAILMDKIQVDTPPQFDAFNF